jgi:hypothetical protein
MGPFEPYSQTYLYGEGTFRGVTVAWPTALVLRFLPFGMELGEQELTPRGTHPVTLFFYDFYRVHMNVPAPLPNMTYHEFVIGVPNVFVSSGLAAGMRRGPYFFMPRLLLDNALATYGGLLWWGFAKQVARMDISQHRYAVRDYTTGAPVISLDHQPMGDLQPLHHFPHFEPIRRLLNQPLITQLPMAMGPYFAGSWFQKNWRTAAIRPLRTVMTISREFVQGVPYGRYPAEGWSEGLDQSVLGSYELQAQWRQTLIYPLGAPALWPTPMRRGLRGNRPSALSPP